METLLDVAWALFAERPYEAITMALVADRAGLAKGTSYRYVRTKEELFLAVAAREISAFFDALDADIDGAPSRWSATGAAELLTRSLIERPDFIRLLGFLQPVLERNVGPVALRSFKTLLAARFDATGSRIEAHVPALRQGDGRLAMVRLYALVIGLRQLAEPLPALVETSAESDTAALSVDFEDELRAAAGALLRGMVDRDR
jgi:AcrR family transcriptional regulator